MCAPPPPPPPRAGDLPRHWSPESKEGRAARGGGGSDGRAQLQSGAHESISAT